MMVLRKIVEDTLEMEHPAMVTCLPELESAGGSVVMVMAAEAMVMVALLAAVVLNAYPTANYREVGCKNKDENMTENAFHNQAQRYDFFGKLTKLFEGIFRGGNI